MAGAKTALRDQLLTTRNRRPLLERSDAARAIARRLTEAPEVRRAATVAAYVAIGSEPGTAPLLHALLAAGKRVVLPVLLPGGDLDWALPSSFPKPFSDAFVALQKGQVGENPVLHGALHDEAQQCDVERAVARRGRVIRSIRHARLLDSSQIIE